MDWLSHHSIALYSIYLLGKSDEFRPLFWASVVGAFVGAAAAFALEWWRRAREQKRNDIAAANIALLTLNSMWWALANYEGQVVRPRISDANKAVPLWLRIVPSAVSSPDLKFDIAALVFLLRPKKSELLPRLILQEQRYRDFVVGIELRDGAISRARDRMEADKIGKDRYATDPELVASIGDRGVGELRTLTVGMIRALYIYLGDMAALYEELGIGLQKQLGKRNIRAFDLPHAKLVEGLKPSPEDWVNAAIAECNSRPRPESNAA